MKWKIIRQIIFMSQCALIGIALQALFSTILLAEASYAQKSIEDIDLNIRIEDARIEKIFSIIEKKTNFKFAYIKSDLYTYTSRISLDFQQTSLGDILRNISKEAHLSFKRVNDNIHVSRSEIPLDKNQNGQVKEVQMPEQINITGKVTSADNGEPLPGVSILVKGTSTGATTNIDGDYKLNASEDDILQFSFIGYETQEITVRNQTNIDIALKPDLEQLEEVVVVGYGAVKKSDLTGSVASINSEDLTSLPVNNVQQILQGRAAGVQVIQNSHSPGGGLSVRIRGTNSVLGGSDPLYVIDGFIGNIGLDAINPNDIESIEILKDASATAIYGSRGANGVVIVTTKRGKKGMDRISFDMFYGVQEVLNKVDVMNARQFAEIANARVLNDGGTEVPFQDLNNLPYDTDWQDEGFRTAPIQNYSLSFAGGSDKTQYLVSANFFSQDGIVRKTDFERGTLRVNIDREIGEKFKVSNSFQISRSVQNNVPEGQQNGAIQMLLGAYPVRPVFEDGEYANMDIPEYSAFSDPIPNPIAELELVTNELKRVRVFNMIYGEYEILEGLKAKVSFGINYQNSRNDNYEKRGIPTRPNQGIASISNSETIDFLNENTLTYTKTIGEHSFTAVGGFTSQRNDNRFFEAGSRDFVVDALETGNLGAGAVIDQPASGGNIWSQQSVLSRINYTFKNKYLFTASGRWDGSSRVAETNRWTFFPSVAFGWKVIEEPFLQNNPVLSNLKLRVSWGQTGNDRIPTYLSRQRISSASISSSDELVIGLTPINVPSTSLKWEVTSQSNIGLDFGFVQDRFRITADYYVKNTNDLLALVQLPFSSGFSNVIQNIGEIRNSGFELSVGTDILTGNFSWTLDGNISSNRNEVIALKDGNDVFAAPLPGGASSGAYHIIREGEELASYFGFRKEGLDESGELVYSDLDNDGEITNADREVLGSFFPDFIYGINSRFAYKGFELSLFFQGVSGNEVLNLNRFRSANSFTRGYNQLSEVSDYWTPENPDAKFPKPRTGIDVRGSDELLEDGSYLRLRNIQLGYSLPQNLLDRIKLQTAKVYVSAQNLFMLTDYKGFDPEVNTQGNSTVGGNTDLRLGMDLSAYPSARTFTMGLSIGF